MSERPERERPDPRTVLVRVRELLPSLRPSERRIAELLLSDPTGSAKRSVAALAEEADTSTTTVVRFYHRVGYAHYRELILELTRESTRQALETGAQRVASGDIDRNDTLDNVVAKVARNEISSISDTAAALERGALAKAVGLVLDARRVDCFGVGAGAVVGLDLQQKLSRIGRVALNWSDAHAAWTAAATLDKGCVAFAISHSGNTIDTVEFLSIARAVGAPTIALTNHRRSALVDVADVVLTTAASETRFRSGALGSRIAQLMVIDCLFTAVAQASYDESIAALQRTYGAVRIRKAAPERAPGKAKRP